jgi:hypothetical protein
MIDYLTDIKPLQDDGVSNADIATHLSSRTAQAMQPAPSQYALQESGAVLTDPVQINHRTGSLITYFESMPEGDDKNLVAWFISEIFSNNTVSTNDYPRSSQYAAIEAGLPASLQPVAAELVSLAGGRPDAGTTEQNVVDIQAQWEAEEAARIAEEQRQQGILDLQAEIDNDYILPALSDGTSTAEQVRASIKAGL